MKHLHFLSCLALLLSVATPTDTSANSRRGAYFTANILPFMDAKEGATRWFLLSELKGAYRFTVKNVDFFVGANFEQERYHLFTDTEEKRMSIGLTMGALIKQWQFNLTYLAYSQYQNNDYDFSYGTGVRGDFAYRWAISKNISAGPQLGLRYLRYRSGDFIGTGLMPDEPKHQLAFIPMFSSAFRF